MKNTPDTSETPHKLQCGIVMPISALDGCTESHWADVLEILSSCIEDAGYEPNLVSNADEVGIIQKRIVQNLYENPIIVCDVSGKNPNVMFELGMRLAFDKPVVVVKDDKTGYSFDTAPIEHLTYPRDLRFAKILEFKDKLREKIQATHKASINTPGYTTFLKHFGEFKVAKLDTKEVSKDEYLLEEIRMLRRSISRLELGERSGSRSRHSDLESDLDVCIKCTKTPEMKTLADILLPLNGVRAVRFENREDGHLHVQLGTNGECSSASIETAVKSVIPEAAVIIRRGSMRR